MTQSFSYRNPLDFIFHFAEESPHAPALLTAESKYTYQSLADSILRQAGWLRSQGVGSGKYVAIYSDDDIFVTITIFAIWSLGAVCMPMNITQPTNKLRLIESIVAPDIAVDDGTVEWNNEPQFIRIAATGEAPPIKDIHTPDPDETAIIMFTSGTSGVPKAVPMTYFGIGHNCWETAKKLKITPQDRIFINSPPYYTSSIIHNLTLYSRGGSIFVDRSLLFGADIFEMIEKYECTGFGGVPVHFARMSGGLDGREQSKRLRFLMNSGEHLAAPLLLEIQKMLPQVSIYCVYGLTEVAGRLCVLDPSMVKKKAGSVGHPLPGMKVTIRDEKGSVLPANKQGEVYVTGVSLMKEYLNNPEANAKSVKPFGFATGDFGRLDSDGYLYLEGRADDIMKVGGEKVSLKMIEESVYGFEAFEDYIVAPFFDKLMGHVPCVYYVLKSGFQFKKKILLKKLKTILPPNHIPAFFNQVEEIPRSTSGKKLRTVFSKNLME